MPRTRPRAAVPEKPHWIVRLGRFLRRNIADVIWTMILTAFLDS